MIIKTKDFDRQFHNDLHWITLNRNLPLQQKGSYKVKEFGDLITDIDLQALVYLNPKLIDIISGVLSKNRGGKSPFTFIHMSVGTYKGFELPWSIDDSGGCNYDPQLAREWFEQFKISALVPGHVLSYMENKLFSDDMRIRNLIDIENIIHPYAEIVWSEDDIRRGFVQRGSDRYYLLDEMKTETPVLEYVYHYRDAEYVAIDVGMVDKKFRVPPNGAMYRYYMDDWYKVMKTYRWKLAAADRPAYFQTMNGITKLIALKYQIGFIEKLSFFNVLPKHDMDALYDSTYAELDQMGVKYTGRKLSELVDVLYEQVNIVLRDSILFYANLLEPVEKEKILLRLARGAEARIPTTQKQLTDRRTVGVKCPFFPTDMDEYSFLTELALKLDMDVDRVVNCFSQVAIEMHKPVSQVIKDVIQPNNLSLVTTDTEVVLNEHGQVKARYPIADKGKLQAYILLKRN